jgi:ABC-type glycerol-3-phosphate transport system permease component
MLSTIAKFILLTLMVPFITVMMPSYVILKVLIGLHEKLELRELDKLNDETFS